MWRLLLEQRGRTCMVGLQSILLRCQAYFRWWRRRVDLDQCQFVAEIADDLSAMMEIWFVDAGIQTKAHIACWHHLVETYRGYLLCSDITGQTFLIDMRTHVYVKGSAAYLLKIDGVEQAKRFVDELCFRLPVNAEKD